MLRLSLIRAFEMKARCRRRLSRWPETRKVLESLEGAVVAALSSDRLTEAQFDAAQEAVKTAAGVKG